MKTKHNSRFSPKIPQTPFNRAVKYLSFRPRSAKEMHDYLVRSQYTEEEVNDTIKKLLEFNFLNDDDYARSFTENRQRKGKSRQSIAFELKLKGINKDQSAEVLEDSNEDFKTALEYIQKRLHQFERFKLEERQKKIITRLRSRGYDWETISKVLKKLEL